MMPNYSRTSSIISPAIIKDIDFSVIGLGATGSRVPLALKNMGAKKITIFDDGEVKPHNNSNQLFSENHIGMFKVDAVNDVLKYFGHEEVKAKKEKATGQTRLGQVVFLLTDTMPSRREIWEGAIKNHPNVEIVVETRMGVYDWRIYTVNPVNPDHVKFYNEKLEYDSDQTSESACQSKTSIGSTASIIANLAVSQVIGWYNMKYNNKPPIDLIEQIGNVNYPDDPIVTRMPWLPVV
jgi:hypothetical protein